MRNFADSNHHARWKLDYSKTWMRFILIALMASVERPNGCGLDAHLAVSGFCGLGCHGCPT